MRFPPVGGKSELVARSMHEMSELINLTGKKDRTKNDGAEEHPAGTVEVSLVNGRNSESHEERTGEQNEGTERSQFDIENISDVQEVTTYSRGDFTIN
jgi:hypothetical protein